MADNAPWEDYQSQSTQPAQEQGPWSDYQPLPKAPDVSGVQKMVQNNLASASNDNKTSDGSQKSIPSPIEHINTATGLPVDKIINGTAQSTDINSANRAQYTKALDNGSAVNSSDWMQTMLHAVNSITPGAGYKESYSSDPLDTWKKSGESVVEAFKGGAGQIMYPFLSKENKDDLLENRQLTDYRDPESPTLTEKVRRGIELEQGTVGTGMGGLFAPAAVVSPAISPNIESIGGEQTKPGELPTWRSLAPGAIGVGMDVLGGVGIYHGTGELGALRQQRAWDQTIRQLTASKLGKNPSAVTPQDVNQVIAEGSKDLHPPGDDFRTAAAATGVPENGFKTVYNDAGVTPDQILTDAEHNPQILSDVSAGKVPEQYEYRVEQKAPLPVRQTDGLHISRDESTRSFSVVDKDGDHIRGGFDSYEEAQHHIEDMRFDAEERKAIEDEKHSQPATEKTNAGEQQVIPGTEKISDKELAERKMEQPLQETVPQKPANEGLFDTGAGKQIDLLDDSTKRQPILETVKETAKLPRELSGAKPRYGYGSKQFTLGFESDIDRALYITAKDITVSKADPRYRQFLRDNGFTDSDIAREGNKLKDRIKATAKNAESGHLTIGESAEKISHQIKPNVIPPSERGKPTSLNSFLRNNGAKFDESDELKSIKNSDGKILKGDDALDHAGLIGTQHGYFRERPLINEVQNALSDNKRLFREKDTDRIENQKENALSKQQNDPVYIEHEAHNVGIDTERVAGETEKQYIKRLTNALRDFYSEQAGSVPINIYRKILGDTISTVEKFAGKLTGGLFDKLAEGYIKTFQPELAGDKALRADAYLAKFKAKLQEAENAYYRQSASEIRRWDKAGEDKQKEWLYDHETGRWDEYDDPDHARIEAIYDAMHDAEKESGVGTDAYKENYLPHQYEKPDAVKEFFRSDAMIKKYGRDWFNKASVFKLVQEADRAGFKLKTYNPERMMNARANASYNLRATMDLLKDMESSGGATRASSFTVDKRIARTGQDIADIRDKYKKELENIDKQKSLQDEKGNPIGEPASKKMVKVQERISDLEDRLSDLKKEKSDIKLTPDQLKELKNGLRIIGPDSKAWNVHPEAIPVWKNAMEMKGLWEREGLTGDSYRAYMGAKAIYVRAKMFASLFHPTHETVIDISSSAASVLHHLIQGGKLSDLTARDIPGRLGLTKNTFKLQDHPKIVSWNTDPKSRTPAQQADVQRMTDGGFVPTISAENKVRIRENFDKAISGIGTQNLRLLGTAIEIGGLPMVPFMEHWIPGMKTDSYFQRTDFALKRDPTLANDSGRRSEVFRKIAQDIERNYGEMNRNTQFWNPILKDVFNATTFSGGWKLAMLQNMRGLAEPAKVAYNWAKTGEFSKEQITHQMLQSYIYTANMLALGAGLTYLLTGTVGTIKDWINPSTGDNNTDGTPIRLRQPAFFNEPMMLLRDINQEGVVAGTGNFLYHQTLVPGIAQTLVGKDFVGRPYITDPTDLQQWKNMGWDSISPIMMSSTEQAEQHGSKTAEHMGWLGFPMAGQWVNESPFEQKVIAKYFEQNPSKDSALQAKLKAEMKGAVINQDTKKEADIEKEMEKEHMSPRQISFSEETHSNKFSKFAWSKLSAQDQRRIIESASDEEKQNFEVKTH